MALLLEDFGALGFAVLSLVLDLGDQANGTAALVGLYYDFII